MIGEPGACTPAGVPTFKLDPGQFQPINPSVDPGETIDEDPSLVPAPNEEIWRRTEQQSSEQNPP